MIFCLQLVLECWRLICRKEVDLCVLVFVCQAVRVEHCERVHVIVAAKHICIANCRECVFFLGVNQQPLIVGDNHKLQVSFFIFSFIFYEIGTFALPVLLLHENVPLDFGTMLRHDEIILQKI